MAHDAVNSPGAAEDSLRPVPSAARWAPLSMAALALAFAALLLLAAGPLGWRAGWWHYRIAFSVLMPWSGYCGIAAAVLGLPGMTAAFVAGRRRYIAAALAAFLLGGAIAYVPWHYERMRGSVPRINDITTDTDNPPQYRAVLPAREADGANPVEYEGVKAAQIQHRAYPDIAPIMSGSPPKAAFERALDIAEKLGWTIVASDPAAGRIEASQSSRWFGFTDDISIRITPKETGSRVDIRSTARFGRRDYGVNATRVRNFLAAFRAAPQPAS